MIKVKTLRSMALGYQCIQERIGPVKLVKIFAHSFFLFVLRLYDLCQSIFIFADLIFFQLLLVSSLVNFLFGYCTFELQNFLWVHFLISNFYCYSLIEETLSLYLPLMLLSITPFSCLNIFITVTYLLNAIFALLKAPFIAYFVCFLILNMGCSFLFTCLSHNLSSYLIF